MSKNTDNMFEFVQAASKRLRGHAHITPIMSSRTLNQRAGAEVYLKCENFQRVGAFKLRGAFNFLSAQDPSALADGVITYSSGNHAQAVAWSAREFGIPATVVMPTDAPPVKRAATLAYGARVEEAGTTTVERKARAEAIFKQADTLRDDGRGQSHLAARGRHVARSRNASEYVKITNRCHVEFLWMTLPSFEQRPSPETVL